jgi:hypothetical protein
MGELFTVHCMFRKRGGKPYRLSGGASANNQIDEPKIKQPGYLHDMHGRLPIPTKQKQNE